MKIVCILLSLILGLGTVAIYGAEIQRGELILEILLQQKNQLKVSSSSRSFVQEYKSPIHGELQGDFSISLQNADTLNLFGILNRVEAYEEEDIVFGETEEQSLRPIFVWHDAKLVIQKERLIFEDISFKDYESAAVYCEETGTPLRNITPIPMIGSQVKIVSSGGKTQYFELPLSLHSEGDLRFGDEKLDFSGYFVIKAVSGKLIICHKIPLEDYIAGVIQNEIGSNAPLEALKTQAVAARSHAISLLLYNKHKNDGYDLCNSTHCQVYKGKHLLNPTILEAVQNTKAEILTFEGRIASTTYHSSSGGKTDSSVNIWKGSVYPYLQGVCVYPEAESYDLSSESGARAWIDYKLNTEGMSTWERSSLSWTRTIPKKDVIPRLGLSRLDSIEILKRGFSGRILSLKFNGNTIIEGEYKIRQIFGNLPSSFFYFGGTYSISESGNPIFRISDTIKVSGKGSGHGVGMCQVSTLQKARAKESYRDILLFFYPGTEFSTDWLNVYE